MDNVSRKSHLTSSINSSISQSNTHEIFNKQLEDSAILPAGDITRSINSQSLENESLLSQNTNITPQQIEPLNSQLEQLEKLYQTYQEAYLQNLSDIRDYTQSLKNQNCSCSQYLNDIDSTLQACNKLLSLNSTHEDFQSLAESYLSQDKSQFLNITEQSLNEKKQALDKMEQSINEMNQSLNEMSIQAQFQIRDTYCFLFYDFCYRVICPISALGILLLILYVYDTPDTFAS